jgi:hypothetical protein
MIVSYLTRAVIRTLRKPEKHSTGYPGKAGGERRAGEPEKPHSHALSDPQK